MARLVQFTCQTCSERKEEMMDGDVSHPHHSGICDPCKKREASRKKQKFLARSSSQPTRVRLERIEELLYDRGMMQDFSQGDILRGPYQFQCGECKEIKTESREAGTMPSDVCTECVEIPGVPAKLMPGTQLYLKSS